MLIQNSILFQWHPRSLRNSKKFNLVGGGENHETIVHHHPHSSTLNCSMFVGGSCGTDVDGLPNYVIVHRPAWRHMTPPPTHATGAAPAARASLQDCIISIAKVQSARFTACSVLTTRQLWLFEREGVNTFGDIEDCAPYLFFRPPPAQADDLSVQWLGAYWPSGVSWKRAVDSKRSLGAYRFWCQLETDRQLQMFLGHVLTLRRDGNVPSIQDVRWGAYWLIWQLETHRQIFVGSVINSVYQL